LKNKFDKLNCVVFVFGDLDFWAASIVSGTYIFMVLHMLASYCLVHIIS